MNTRLTVLLLLATLLAPSAAALPTPGFFGEEAREVTGRIFPEALETNDYVSYAEARDGLALLASENPDLVELVDLGESAGWDNAVTGEHDTFTPFAVLVTNKASGVAEADRVNLLFMLSIHGNEKGGREGGFRVIEDFVKAANGDDETGIGTPERLLMLDYMRLIFLFPNPDGWVHEELEYRNSESGYFTVNGLETMNFVRVNGNGVDLNRQTPTQGWSRAETSDSHKVLSQPESRAYVPWLKNNFERIHYASDIHGMLHPADALIDSSEEVVCGPEATPPELLPFGNPEDLCLREGHFILTLIPAGRFDPIEEVKITGLSELLEDRLNSDPYFAEWNNMPEAGVWGGEYNSWGTVWDTIGYVDSGFSGDFFAQDIGLDAPGMDFEMAYNHVTFDNYYPVAARINDFHVQSVRHMVSTFMDYAAQDVRVSIDTRETRTAWVPTSVVMTNLDDEDELTGWAAENTYDDAWDIAHTEFTATINDYFRDLKPFLNEDGAPGVLDEFRAQDLASSDLSSYDNLVIPGSAARDVRTFPGAIDAVRAYVAQGGNLVLTDEAVSLLADIGGPAAAGVDAPDIGGLIDEAAIEEVKVYAAHTDWVDRDHPLALNGRGWARQLAEPMPLGYEEGSNMPEWTVDRSSFEGLGGEVVGVLDEPDRVALGLLPVGDGSITIIGGVLPDPTEEYYHPYGLASYATTYTGNQVIRNALGWQLSFETPPRVVPAGTAQPNAAAAPTNADTGDDGDTDGVPGAPAMAVVVALMALALVARRRRHS